METMCNHRCLLWIPMMMLTILIITACTWHPLPIIIIIIYIIIITITTIIIMRLLLLLCLVASRVEVVLVWSIVSVMVPTVPIARTLPDFFRWQVRPQAVLLGITVLVQGWTVRQGWYKL